MPSFVAPLGVILAVAALVPLAMVAMSRGGTSETPRLSIWWDMDYQPKYKAQTTIDSSIFPDGRAARLPVEGTISRSGLMLQDALHLGYEPEAAETFPTAFLQDEAADEAVTDAAADETKTTAEPAAADNQTSSDDTEEATANVDEERHR